MLLDLRGQLQRTLGTAYTLERELGGGGMSRVFVAEETALRRKVVVKVLPPELAAGVNVERFNREILVAAKLQHAHIVPVLSAGETDGLPYYTMPFVEGESLRERLTRTNSTPITEIVGILRDVSKALAFAHERGVVHRDIKPDNVLLAGGSAVVTDFGIAKALAAAKRGGRPEGDNPKDPLESALTLLGTSIGTPVYMAPEQAAADPSLDHRADIYSFGCMAYEMLAGQPPFHGRTPQQLLAAHMAESAAPVVELRLDCPPMLADLVMRCLAKSADERPQSAGEIIRVLETVTSGSAQPAMPAILVGGRGMLGKALALYAVAFVLVAVLAKAAIAVVGLPDWVFPGALVVMALGLPVILVTGYVHYTARRVLTATPTFTPGGTPSLAQGTMATIAVKASPHMSWRRAGLGGGYAVCGFVLLVGAFMALRAMGIGPAGSLLAAGALTATDAIVVADFSVKGGADSSLGGVLSDAVKTDLAQSKVLTVASASAIAGGLRRMQKPASSRLTSQLARELAQREGMKAVVEGELTPLGAGFIVTTRLVNATTGDELASSRETAASPTELLPTVDKLARRLRGKVGESLKAVRASPSLAQVTTSSLDALRKYSEGSRAIDYEADFAHAIPLLREAVAADSTFAMAWRKLSVAYSLAGLPGRDAAATNAYRFRDRLPEQERMAVVAYYFYGPGSDRAKAIEAYEAMAKTGINVGTQNLGVLYSSRRDFVRAESVYKRVISSGGAARVTFTNLASALYAQGRFAEAETVSSRTDSLFPSAVALSLHHHFLLNRGQLDSAQRLYTAARTRPDPTVRVAADLNIAQLQLMRGQLAASARTNEAMIGDNQARGVALDAFDVAMRSAFIDTWYREQPARALRTLDSAFAKQQDRARYQQRLAELYANAGRPDRARQFLTEFLKEPRDSLQVRQQESPLHNTRAQVLLAEGKAIEAVAEFRAADQAPDGPVSTCAICLYANLAQAFDRANVADSAIMYYERYVTTPMLNRLFQDPQYLAGTLKRLGELYEAKGDRQKAASVYTRFVALWKDADPELQPKVAEVRRRLAVLSRAETAR